MAELFVDLAALRATSAQLGRVESELRAASSALRAVGSADLGSSRLAGACDGFRDRWGHGIGQLGRAADVVRQQLDEALRVYGEVDAALLQGPPR
ncbi:MAG TPA: hypothetical protein VNU66_01000 [Mycobacteriales bacterium]|nr:hypothetical protein [Mycobacteriales bacterium]